MAMTVAKIGGKPRTEFLYLPFGRVHADRAVAGGSFTFTRTLADQAVACFRALGRRLTIDYEHQSIAELNKRADKLAPAAGWIGGMEVRADGLWATRVDWTRQAAELLASGQYQYFSPVIYWTSSKCDGIRGLGPVALTNDPAISGVQALVAAAGGGACGCGPYLIAADAPPAAEQHANPGPSSGDGSLNRPRGALTTGGPRMDRIAKALGLDPGANEEQILAAIEELVNAAAGAGEQKTVGRRHDGSLLFRGPLVAAFNASPELQREFGDVETFIAFRANQEAGHVTIAGHS